MNQLKTPYFLIEEDRLIENLEKAKRLKELSGVKLVLALKCFSTWGVFDIIKPYLDGTTSSGPFEVKLGYEPSAAKPTPTALATAKTMCVKWLTSVTR